MSTFLATTGYGLARASLSANGEWSVEFLLNGQDVRSLAADPLNPMMLFAGTQGKGVLRSVDGGRTWRSMGLAGQIVKALAVSRTQPGTVYAGTKPALLFVSRDGGASWTELESFRRIPSRRFWFSPAEKPFSAYVQAIALSPIDPQVLLVGIEAGAVVRSTDGGRSWTGHRRGALHDCHALTFHATNGDWIYEGGGTGTGVSVSRDSGTTWIQLRAGLSSIASNHRQAEMGNPAYLYCALRVLLCLPCGCLAGRCKHP